MAASHVHHLAGAWHCFLLAPAVGFPVYFNAGMGDVAFFLPPWSYVLAIPFLFGKGPGKPNPTETSTAAGRGVRGGVGTAYAGPLWKWGFYDYPALWLGGMASRRGSSLNASLSLAASPFPTKAVGDRGALSQSSQATAWG